MVDAFFALNVNSGQFSTADAYSRGQNASVFLGLESSPKCAETLNHHPHNFARCKDCISGKGVKEDYIFRANRNPILGIQTRKHFHEVQL